MGNLVLRFRPLSKILSNLAVALIDVYRFAFSGLLGGRCRFTPTCSSYAREAFATFGFWRGAGMSLKRMGRCHPWGGYGHDPVKIDKEGSYGTKVSL